MFKKLFGRQIDFSSRLSPNELWRRITATSDAKRIAFFAASGFEGSRRFLYSVNGSEIKVNLRQRKKGIPPILTMKIEPTNYGCRILGNIAVEKTSWIFLAVLMIIFAVIGTALIYPMIGSLWTGQPLTKFTPFDFFALVFLVNVVILPVFINFKVRSDTNELFGWLESLIADSVIKS